MSAKRSENCKCDDVEPYLGRKLQDLRENRGMTRRQVAEILHVSEDVVKNHEKGISQVKAEDLFDYLRIYNAKFEEVAPKTLLDLYKSELTVDPKTQTKNELIMQLQGLLLNIDDLEYIVQVITMTTIYLKAQNS